MYQPGGKEKFFQMVPVSIREGSSVHTLYFYPAREEVRKMAERFISSQSQEDTSVPVSIEELTDSQIQIRMLEGILAATEKRLTEYIKTEKELRRELELVTQGKQFQ